MVVDDVWCSVGSVNFDEKSFRPNDEANLNVYSAELAAKAAHDGGIQEAAVWGRLMDSLLTAFSRNSRTARRKEPPQVGRRLRLRARVTSNLPVQAHTRVSELSQ